MTGAGLTQRFTEESNGPGLESHDFNFAPSVARTRVLVYGSGVDLVADRQRENESSPGLPDASLVDGKYSLNGADFVSLPGVQTDWRAIGSNG